VSAVVYDLRGIAVASLDVAVRKGRLDAPPRRGARSARPDRVSEKINRIGTIVATTLDRPWVRCCGG
jgi:hypothetical protein